MRGFGSRAGRGTLALAAVAGTVAAHGAAWVLAVPDGTRRHDALLATGHGWWPLAVADVAEWRTPDGITERLNRVAVVYETAVGAGVARVGEPNTAWSPLNPRTPLADRYRVRSPASSAKRYVYGCFSTDMRESAPPDATNSARQAPMAW